MRKIIVFSLAVSLGILTACTGGNASAKINPSKLADAKKRDLDISKGAPIITLDKKEYDFGTVTDGEIIETTFIVTNTGKSPLIITDAKTTCGCTVPTWPKDKPIAPGESTNIEVKFDSILNANHFYKNKEKELITIVDKYLKDKITVL